MVDSEVQRLIQLTNKVSDFLRNPVGTPQRLDVVALIEGLRPTFQGQITFC